MSKELLNANKKASSPTKANEAFNQKPTTKKEDDMNSLALSFNDVQFDIVDHLGQVWLRASEVAQALGYSRSDKIGEIYRRHADEFTASMTLTLSLGVKGFGNGESEKEVRIFSLRGCHLLAMFARTTIAKQFRKWVLDVLDTVGVVKLTPPPANPYLALRNAVHAAAKGSRQAHSNIYNSLYRKFQVTSYKEISAEQCAAAIEFIRSLEGDYIPRDKIAAPKPSLALCDGQHYVVAKDGEVLLHKVLSHDINDSFLKSTPKPALIADFSKKSVFEHKRQSQRHLLSLDVFLDGYGWEGNPLRRLFALLKQAKKDGTTVAVNDIEGAELVFSVTESLGRQYKQSLDEISRHASNASDRGCYLPIQCC